MSPCRSDTRPRVLLVGGSDIDARLGLMQALKQDFRLVAAGTSPHLRSVIQQAGFEFNLYPLARRVNPIADIRTLSSLVWLFRRHRFELVHSFDTKPSVLGRLAASITGVPVIIGTLPGLGSLYVEDSVTNSIVRILYERLQELACHLSDLTIFQNHDDAQQFITRGIVPAPKATVIPGSGVRTDLFDPSRFSRIDRERVRAELGVRDETLLITMVSRLIRSKGVHEFAAAARSVSSSHPDVEFLLVGSDDKDSVDRLTPAELSRITQWVKWAGMRNDIPAVLAASDIFVLPSFYREGIPRVLLEAAAMSLPIITTDSPGCREVVAHDVNGFLVPSHDSDALTQGVLRLTKDPAMRLRFGHESRRRAVARFDLSSIADQVRSIYQELLARKGLLPTVKA